MLLSRVVAVLVLSAWLDPATAENAPNAEPPMPPSPRLASLKAALDQSDPSALDAFWREIGRNHTPLVEDIPNRPHEALYTFLIRADPTDDVMNARLGADFPMRSEHHTDAFARLGTSGVWFASYVLPKGSIIDYRIRVPQGLQRSTTSEVRFTIDGVLYEHYLDPLNPRVFPDGKNHVDAPSSYYRGPEAPENRYLELRAEVARGSLKEFVVESRVLESNRTVTMYTPAGYGRWGKALPLILQFDGESYLTDVAAPTMLDNMIAQEAIPPVVVAFLHSGETRNEDLQPNAKFQQFIKTELVPWIRTRYRVSTNPKLNVVSGSSFGGLAAGYTAYTHPELFGNVLSQSGSFWWTPKYLLEPSPSPNAGWMVKQYAESASKHVRFYLSVGSWESPGMLSSNRILSAVLKGKGDDVVYSEVLAGHNYSNFQQGFPEGLKELLKGQVGPH